MIPSPVRPVVLKQKEGHKLYWKMGPVFSPYKTLGGACKHKEPNLTSKLSPDAQSGYIIYVINCTEITSNGSTS